MVSRYQIRGGGDPAEMEWRDWAHLLLEAPFLAQNDQFVIPDRPGLGISWNQEAVSPLLVR